jgi:hypothetical protein
LTNRSSNNALNRLVFYVALSFSIGCFKVSSTGLPFFRCRNLAAVGALHQAGDEQPASAVMASEQDGRRF